MNDAINESDAFDLGIDVKAIARRVRKPRSVVKEWLEVGQPTAGGKLVRLTPARRFRGEGWRVKAADLDEWMRTHIDPNFTPNEPAPETREQRVERLRAELREIDDKIHTLYARRCDRRDELQELHQDVTELELVWNICDADF